MKKMVVGGVQQVEEKFLLSTSMDRPKNSIIPHQTRSDVKG
jgi:hypothetical protein